MKHKTAIAASLLLLLIGGAYWLMSLARAKPTRVLHGDDGLMYHTYAPTARLLVTVAYKPEAETRIQVWDVDTLEEVFETRTADSIGGITISDNGKWFALRTYVRDPTAETTPRAAVRLEPRSSTLRIWSLETGALQHERPLQGVMGGMAFTPDGARMLVVGKPNDNIRTQLFEVETGKTVVEFDAYPSPLSIHFTPDGRTLLADHGLEPGRKRVCQYTFWDTTTGAEIRSVTAHQTGVSPLALSPDGTRVASSDLSGELKIWDAQSGEEIQRINPPDGRTNSGTVLQFSADGGTLFVRHVYKVPPERNFMTETIRDIRRLLGKQIQFEYSFRAVGVLVETETGNVIKQIEWDGETYPMAITPDAKQIITSGGERGAIEWWDIDDLPAVIR